MNKKELNLRGSHLVFVILILFTAFLISNFFNILLLKQLIGLLFLLFIPGFIISLLVHKKITVVERFVYSVAISIILVIVVTLFLNLALKIKIDNNFSVIVFLVCISPLALLIKEKNSGYKIEIKKFDKLDYLFILIIILSLVVRIILFSNIHTILGADIGRFSIISHTYFLKQEITPDLRPYDMASEFFYFPGAFIFPLLLELIGFDPIFGMTLGSFIIDIVSLFAFYILSTKFFDRKIAINAFFFYSFLLDALLNMAIFGVFPHAFSVFYLFLLLSVTTDIFFKNKRELILLSFAFLGIFSFHLYSIFIFIPFLFSLFSYEIILKKKITTSVRLSLELIKSGLLVVLLMLPFLLVFGQYYSYKFDKENIADLVTFSFGRNIAPLYQKIIGTLFSSPVGLPSTVVSFLGFIVFLIAIRKFIKTEAVVFVFFFLYSTLFVFFVFEEYNLFRNVFGIWIVYALSFALTLDRPYLNLLILPLFFFSESQSPLYLAVYMKPMENPAVPWIIWPEYNDMIRFIQQSIPPNATFLIDGGGAGCTGANPSYGERIFPLTSRKIFYFTDYCWAEYNRTDYQNRVELYRRVSINPDDDKTFKELKSYNITHVYVGPYSVGLKAQLFSKSEKYKLVFEKNGNYIFQLN